MQKDYYKILGIPKDATIKQIKKIYKSLSRCYHPDVNDLSNANEKMEEINEAYRALSNPHERQSHDDDISSVKSFTQPRLNINLSKIKITATTSYSDYDGLSHTTYVSNLRCYWMGIEWQERRVWITGPSFVFKVSQECDRVYVSNVVNIKNINNISKSELASWLCVDTSNLGQNGELSENI